MSWTQVAQHVRREIEGAGELGLDWVEFSEVVGRQIRRLVAYDAACWHTLDPATLLLTGNALTNLSDDGLPVLAACEYGPDDVNKWAFLARQSSVAGRLRAATQGQPRLSPRYRQLLHPSGIESELRVSFVDGSAGWGAAGFYRADENDEFTNDDEVFLAWLAPAVARGYRHALVLDLLDESQTPGGPGLIVLDAADEIQAISPPAEDWLGTLMGGTPAGRTLPLAVLALAARARAMDDMGVAAESSARVRTPQGEWLLLRATPLHGATNGLLGITIEPAGPPRHRAAAADRLRPVDTRAGGRLRGAARRIDQEHRKRAVDLSPHRPRPPQSHLRQTRRPQPTRHGCPHLLGALPATRRGRSSTHARRLVRLWSQANQGDHGLTTGQQQTTARPAERQGAKRRRWRAHESCPPPGRRSPGR